MCANLKVEIVLISLVIVNDSLFNIKSTLYEKKIIFLLINFIIDTFDLLLEAEKMTFEA